MKNNRAMEKSVHVHTWPRPRLFQRLQGDKVKPVSVNQVPPPPPKIPLPILTLKPPVLHKPHIVHPPPRPFLPPNPPPPPPPINFEAQLLPKLHNFRRPLPLLLHSLPFLLIPPPPLPVLPILGPIFGKLWVLPMHNCQNKSRIALLWRPPALADGTAQLCK